MPKMNKLEHQILKDLDSKWQWIARDNRDRLLFVYNVKPRKGKSMWGSEGWDDDFLEIKDNDLFRFIEWWDEEPHSINELIEAYESEHKNDKTEVEKLNNKIRELESYNDELIRDNNQLRNAIDNQETLSQEWIDKRKKSFGALSETAYSDDYFIPVENLQNLLVPKQEKVKISKSWHDIIIQNKEEGHSLRWTLNYIDNLPASDVDKFARAWLTYPNIEVEEEQKYYVRDERQIFLLAKIEDEVFSVAKIIEEHGYLDVKINYQLTEQEIEDYDERYMAFAVKVEELEE